MNLHSGPVTQELQPKKPKGKKAPRTNKSDKLMAAGDSLEQSLREMLKEVKDDISKQISELRS